MTDLSQLNFTNSFHHGLAKQFQDVQLIGKGTFSSVYSARDVHLDRDVAIKAIAIDSDLPERNREVANREISILSKLNHPGIIRLLDVAICQNTILLIQPLCANGALDQAFDGKAMEYSARTSAIEALLQATQYLHGQGWLHCDIKPANLLLDSKGMVLLSDFGDSQEINSRNASARPVGSVGYMAPELFNANASPSIQTDIYSIGITIYELLTGERAFPGDTTAAMLAATARGVPKLKSSVPSAIDWNAILQKATCLEVKNRYTSVRELASDVQRIYDHQPVSIRKISLLETALRWIKREPVTASLILSLAAIVLVGSLASAAAWLEASKQSILSKENEADLERRSKESMTAKKNLESSLQLAKEETEKATKTEEETQQAIIAITTQSEELNRQTLEAERLSSELLASVQALEQSTQKQNLIQSQAEIVARLANETEAKFLDGEYWRLLNKARTHLELDEFELAMEAIDDTPEKLRRAEYALLRGLIENRWRYPKRQELATIEFEEEDDSNKTVAVSNDGRYFVRCAPEQVKIISLPDGKLDTFKLPKLRGANRIFLRFDEDASRLLIAVTSESKCSGFSLENRNGVWQMEANPIQMEGPCFEITEFHQGRAFFACTKSLNGIETVELIEPASGLPAWSERFDSKVLEPQLVTSGWLPKGNNVIILYNAISILIVDDGVKLNQIPTTCSLTKKLLSSDLSFFHHQSDTTSLGLKQCDPESKIRSPLSDVTRDNARNEFNKLRGSIQREFELFQTKFVSNAAPDRSAWLRDNEKVAYFVVTGRNGNLAIPLHQASERCFPLNLTSNNELLCVVYPEPSKNSLFQRDSIQLPKAILVQYNFGGKGMDRLRSSSSPFLDRTPAEVLSSREGPAAPQSQVDFFVDLEDPEKRTKLKEVRYRCYAPDAEYSGERKIGFRQPVSIVEPNVSGGTKYRIELDAGSAFETLKVDVQLNPGEITELGRLTLKPAVLKDKPIEISGTVSNAEGEPLAGVEVASEDAKTFTDQEGKFQLVGLSGRNIWLKARMNGYLECVEFFSAGDTSRVEFKKNIVLSKRMRVRLRYAFSDYRSNEFVQGKGESATIEVDVDSQSYRLKSMMGLLKQFDDIARRTDLRIEINAGTAILKGGTEIGTADQDDFDLISKAGKLEKDQRLLVGKTIIVRGFDPSRKKNRLDYCVKILVESIE